MGGDDARREAARTRASGEQRRLGTPDKATRHHNAAEEHTVKSRDADIQGTRNGRIYEIRDPGESSKSGATEVRGRFRNGPARGASGRTSASQCVRARAGSSEDRSDSPLGMGNGRNGSD